MVDVEWIRAGLQATNTSQRELAAAVDIDETGMSRLLSGQRDLKADEERKIRAFLAAKAKPAMPGGMASASASDLLRTKLTLVLGARFPADRAMSADERDAAVADSVAATLDILEKIVGGFDRN